MRALLRKEWREHRAFLLLLYAAGAAMLGVLWVQARDAISPLLAWLNLVQTFGTAAAVLVTNRFVMREYGAGTQLFLEALPVGRGRVLATKWLAGAGALMLFFVPAFAIVAYAARERVFLFGGMGGLAAALLVRGTLYLLCVYAAAFAIALTLRFRFAVWGTLFFGALVAGFQLQLPQRQWPPFVLVGDAMAANAALPSWRELAPSAGLTAALIAAAAALALAARGALPVVLARPMSARGRTVVAFVLAGMVGLTSLLEQRKSPPPFRLEQGVSNKSLPAVHVGWLHDVAGVPPARLASRIAADLVALQAWLGLGTPAQLAQLSLVPDAWLEPDEFTLGGGSPGHLVVRAALGAPDLALPELRSAARVAHLIDRSPIQGWREDRAWLLGGFSTWWGVMRDDAGEQDDVATEVATEVAAEVAADAADPAQRAEDRRALLQARAVAAVRLLRARGLGLEAALRRADTAAELLGDCLNDAFAWRAVQTLHDELGPDRFRTLMRAALAGPSADGVGALVRVRAMAGLLDDAGVPLPALAAAIARDLGREGAASPASAPSLAVDAVPQGGGMFALRYRVTNAPAGLAVRYKLLRPMEPLVDRMDTAWSGAAAGGTLPVTFPSGARVLVMADARDPALECRTRLGAVRKAVP